MKTTLLFLLCLLTVGFGYGQNISISPNPFQETQEITITVTNVPAWGNNGVYLWAWYFKADGTFGGNPSATGSNFDNSPEMARLTKNSNGSYTYKFTPTSFYNASNISRIGLLVKSKDAGPNDTEKSDDELFNVGTPPSGPTPVEASVPTGMQDGFNYDPAQPTMGTFVLFAPQKQFVNLIGNFNGNDWTIDDTYLLKKDTARTDFGSR